MKIFLDDYRTPLNPDWVVCRSFEEFVNTLSQFAKLESPTVCDVEITFDHDLADEHYLFDFDALKDDPYMTGCVESGYDCAEWLIKNNIIPKMFWVHSANPIGSRNIIRLLNEWYTKNQISTRGVRTIWPLNWG